MKNQKGITLVALIITIIVMLILAGVSISLVVGEDGVLTQAQNAGEKTKQGEVRQAIELAFSDLTMQYYQRTDDTKTKNYNEAQEVFELENVVATMAANSNGSFTVDNVTLVGAFDYEYETTETEDNVYVAAYDSTKVPEGYADFDGVKAEDLADKLYKVADITPATFINNFEAGENTVNEVMLGDGTLYVNVNIDNVDYLYELEVNKGNKTYTLGSITEVEVAE